MRLCGSAAKHGYVPVNACWRLRSAVWCEVEVRHKACSARLSFKSNKGVVSQDLDRHFNAASLHGAAHLPPERLKGWLSAPPNVGSKRGQVSWRLKGRLREIAQQSFYSNVAAERLALRHEKLGSC